MEYQRTILEITWQAERGLLDFFFLPQHILINFYFTSELLTCFFILDAHITPIKMARKDK